MGKTTINIKKQLELLGWKRCAEGWRDPVKGDKITLNAAWQRVQRNKAIKSMKESKKKSEEISNV
jgi:hypothetical protein